MEPGIITSPKIELSSFFKKILIFIKKFDHWEFINQYIWGRKKTLINTEIQFNAKLTEKILMLGSNDENKLIINI